MLNQSLFSLFLILKKLTIQFHKRITHILLTFVLTFSTYSFAQVPQCELMPLSIPSDAVNNATVGGSVNNLQLKVGKGNFSWLSWSGVTDSPTLANSLILPGDSYNYNASDGELNIGDWAQGSPGIESSDAVHAAMAQLLGQEIFVPIYDETTGSGSSFDYKVSNFAKIILTDTNLVLMVGYRSRLMALKTVITKHLLQLMRLIKQMKMFLLSLSSRLLMKMVTN